jgi:hypothetical protein
VILRRDRTIDQATYTIIGTNDVVSNGEQEDDLEIVEGEVAVILPNIETLATEYRKLLANFAPSRCERHLSAVGRNISLSKPETY